MAEKRYFFVRPDTPGISFSCYNKKEKQNSKEYPKCLFQFIETEDFSWAVQKI